MHDFFSERAHTGSNPVPALTGSPGSCVFFDARTCGERVWILHGQPLEER